ncbi:biopolymer transporter ExbD [Kaustia mangrovi]|uniref:Biopolymer transporter ExbD n=1 Tax=Kaustia mangrovi TaxID=2593653 RepID=A0A7S8C1V6_9HYPH|nr:biopolymer transporter ExbD [Kaustia mangrovi]QPC41839.1 biopolymer transporter ExbD [Kaustia mangrovi]
MRIEAQTRRRAAPSLTPLIDVVFLLLLFFMLASTFARFASVDIAIGQEGGGAPSDRPAVLVSVTQEGGYAVNGTAVELAALAQALADAAAEEEVRIIVKPSASARAQDVLQAVERAKAAAVGPVVLIN